MMNLKSATTAASRFLAIMLLAWISACATNPAPVEEDGWIALLDGTKPETMSNWERVGNANWRFVDGLLVADKGGAGNSDLVTKHSYGDFVLRAEFWADANTNSGIHIRVQDPAQITTKNSYAVNIFDARPDASYGTGAIVGVATVATSYKTAGQWNTYVITARGPKITVELNGVPTVAIDNAQFSSGRIALQYAPPGGAIKFRKVALRPL